MPAHPYKFLDPFGLKDEPIFFGREAATEALAKTVLRDRLTVLHAKSGAGKTSLLNAGLSPRLIREGRLPLYVHAYYQDEDPVMSIKRSIASAGHGPWPQLLHDLPLHDFLSLVCARLGRNTYELVVMLDQFEQFFILWSRPEARCTFINALSLCDDDQTLPLRFIIALRKDYYSDLGEFGRVVSHFHVFRNEYWLNPMTLEEMHAAITRPLTKQDGSVTYEPALLETFLMDLDRSGMELPLLQIICTRLYETRAAGEAHISLKTYETLGRAEGVLGNYLKSELGKFLGREEALARSVLKELVRSDGTKQALSDKMLAARVESRREELDSVLHQLVNLRLLRRDEVKGEVLYELAHEYLATEIVKWVNPADQELKQAEELLQRELVNWRVLHVLIPRDRLEVLYPYRERFKDMDADTWRCVISSALVEDFAAAGWTKTAGDIGELVLSQVLKTADARMRHKVVKMLGKTRDPSTIKLLIAVLKDENAEVRWQTAWALAQIGSRAFEPLIAALQDEDAKVREGAVWALGAIEDPRVVEPLIAALQDEDSKVREGAAMSLGETRDPCAIEPLIAALQDENEDVRERAARALGETGDPRAIEPLIAALGDESENVRGQIAKAIGAIEDPRAIEPLIAILKDEDARVREGAEWALGEMGELAIEPLIAILKDEDAGVREGAVWALSASKDPRAIEPLIAALQDEDARVRRTSAFTLATIEDPRFVEPLIAALQDEDAEVRKEVVWALGVLKDPRAIEPLTAILKDEDAGMQMQASSTLGRIGSLAVKPLIAALLDENVRVRAGAAKALGWAKDLRALEPLIASLQDEDAKVREEAVWALREIGTSKAISALENARKEDMEEVWNSTH